MAKKQKSVNSNAKEVKSGVKTVSSFNSDSFTEKVNALTREISEQSKELRDQLENSEVQRGLRELNNATVVFKSLSQDVTRTMAQPVGAEADSFTQDGPRDCGCGSGCGDDKSPKCCIEVYMSGARVLQGQKGEAGPLELIFAAQAGDTWGLAPGLGSHIAVRPGSRGIKLNDPIARFCVPCGECMDVPVHAEVAETSDGSAWGSLWEGRLEVGSEQRMMTIRCDCTIAPIAIPVQLTKKNDVHGVVEVEISARKIAGGCC